MNLSPSSHFRHIGGLNSIRFIAAIWVVLSHFGLPPLAPGLDKTQWFGYAAKALSGVIVSGPAAVIVFFVVSGFCIHYPYACGTEFKPLQFLTKRLIRIGIPLIVIVCVSPIAGLPFSVFDRMAIWSLFSELIYYALYPALRVIRRKVSLQTVLVFAYIVALGVIMLNLPLASRTTFNVTWGDYPSFGIIGNALLGLPCWLLGVRLAEYQSTRTLATAHELGPSIWMWRGFIWVLSVVALTLRFHSPIGYPWSLNIFAIAVYFWLRQEIKYYSIRKPWSVFESGGKWSYSLYLMHPVAQAAYVGVMAMTELGQLIDWLLLMSFICLASYVFFITIERPSHRLAKMCNA